MLLVINSSETLAAVQAAPSYGSLPVTLRPPFVLSFLLFLISSPQEKTRKGDAQVAVFFTSLFFLRHQSP